MVVLRLVDVARFFMHGYTTRNLKGHLVVAVQVIGIIVVLWAIGGWSYLPVVMVGSILNAAIAAGVGQLAVDLNGLIRSKWKDFFVAFPLHPLEFAIGFSIGASSLRFVGALSLAVLLVAMMNLTVLEIFYLTIIMVSTWLMMVSLGFYIGLRFRDPLSVMRVSEVAGLLLTFLSPVFFPLDAIPMPLRIVALASPSTPAAVLMRNSIGVRDGLDILPIHGYMLLHLVYLVLFTTLSVRYARWTEE